MNLFFVALDDDNHTPDEVNDLVSKHYKDTNYRLNPLTWVIGSDSTDPSEICRKLGINKQVTESQQATGIVARIDDYSGYADKDLWSLMRRWLTS